MHRVLLWPRARASLAFVAGSSVALPPSESLAVPTGSAQWTLTSSAFYYLGGVASPGTPLIGDSAQLLVFRLPTAGIQRTGCREQTKFLPLCHRVGTVRNAVAWAGAKSGKGLQTMSKA